MKSIRRSTARKSTQGRKRPKLTTKIAKKKRGGRKTRLKAKQKKLPNHPRYHIQGRTQKLPTYVYTLKLKQGKYYVGSSSDPTYRLVQHKRGGLGGAAWTTKYTPIKMIACRQVANLIKGGGRKQEDAETKKVMQKYGIENVRGGTYSQVNLSEATVSALHAHIFKKKRLPKDFKQMEKWHQADACMKCGSTKHWSSACRKNKK
tara:strand:+ start:414 stop:1025 length:612 start_codon:yes stop_codon:yes gene_type:complete